VSVALVVVATLLACAAAGSAAGKLARVPRVVETMHAVGVSDGQMKGLAALELLGAAGLVAGIWVPGLGALAAVGLTLYFLGAVIAHVRARQAVADMAPAAALAVLSLVTLLLELAR